ncbi:MAG TPA: hypothetical protein VF112_01275 [Candidatus Dormibacteraeota bacterium]
MDAARAVGPLAALGFVLLAGCSAPSARSAARTPAAPPPPPAWTAPRATPPPGSGRPPQFVAVSFDGSGDIGLWRYWREVARRDHAHLTFLLSGVYLLSSADARLYHPPRRPAGTSDIGFVEAAPGMSDRATIAGLLDEIAAGRAEGNELGTHFNGHFCGPRGVASWTAADWGAELDAFDSLLAGARVHSHLTEAQAAAPPPPAAIVGARTPCLEGDPGVLYPVLRARGFHYDSSTTANLGEWPVRDRELWSLPLTVVHRSATPYDNVAMDYSFYVNQSGAVDAPATVEPVLEEQTYASYLEAFRTLYASDRAPLIIGHHFTTWNHGAYLRALTRLLDTVCGMPEVRCVSLAELAEWLDAHPQ